MFNSSRGFTKSFRTRKMESYVICERSNIGGVSISLFQILAIYQVVQCNQKSKPSDIFLDRAIQPSHSSSHQRILIETIAFAESL